MSTQPEEFPQADQIEGAPHPRFCPQVFGQDAAAKSFLEAFHAKRLHHAWLITGPRGSGKASLGWQIAKFLLHQQSQTDAGMFAEPGAPPATSLADYPADPSLQSRIEALSEPRLALLRRRYDEKTKKLRQAISVDDTRSLRQFFALSAADGGMRVAIVDSADEMNSSAANAFLKTLEEPPEKTLFLLISHQPNRLLPTIRSRCRMLHCHPLAPADLQNALQGAGIDHNALSAHVLALADGSAGAAVELIEGQGAQHYQRILDTIGADGVLDRNAAIALAQSCAGPQNAKHFRTITDLIQKFTARLARFGVLQPAVWEEAANAEARRLASLAPNAQKGREWAALCEQASGRLSHARAVSLDPAAVVLDMFHKMSETARK